MQATLYNITDVSALTGTVYIGDYGLGIIYIAYMVAW